MLHFEIECGFHIFSSLPVKGRVFRFAGGTDRESGGFVLAEFKKNFDHCVKEKSKKIRDHYPKYASWWLVLVDKIAYGFDESEKKRNQVDGQYEFLLE